MSWKLWDLDNAYLKFCTSHCSEPCVAIESGTLVMDCHAIDIGNLHMRLSSCSQMLKNDGGIRTSIESEGQKIGSGKQTKRSLPAWSNWNIPPRTATQCEWVPRSPCLSNSGTTIAPTALDCRNSTNAHRTFCSPRCADRLGRLMAYHVDGFF